MPKADKKSRAKKLTGQESSYTLMPWGCNHYPTYSEIEVYIPITGSWEIVADIHDTKGVDAEILTGLITRAVNSYEKSHDMMAQMTRAIELCLGCGDCLSGEAAHEAQRVLSRGKIMG
jgi:hypothetical protein